jgi:hypothetical protein
MGFTDLWIWGFRDLGIKDFGMGGFRNKGI